MKGSAVLILRPRMKATPPFIFLPSPSAFRFRLLTPHANSLGYYPTDTARQGK
jgi:hypothetical protein